jgi:NAD(P)-dependent dehydrogenase (short-subunit alcohol dehydrogenase family)
VLVLELGVSTHTAAHLQLFKDEHEHFPHDSTGNQLFRADRFDAYVALGRDTAAQAISAEADLFAESTPNAAQYGRDVTDEPGRGRTVLVTGANSGIGLATVVEAARRGFDAVGTVRSEAKADIVRAAAADAGVDVTTELLDVADPEASADVIARHEPWAVVNNAGYSAMGAVEDVGDDEARDVLEVMVVAPMRLARLALPAMRAAGGGRIVNVSSIYGFTTTPFTGWYQASKHALEAVSDALRVEVAADGIDVVLVQPGAFKTGIWDEAQSEADRRDGSRYADAYRRALGLSRRAEPLMGRPERVAEVIVDALTARSPRARYLVGTDAMMLAAAEAVSLTQVKDRLQRLVLGL